MFREVYTTGFLPLGHKSPNKVMTVCPHHKDLMLEEALQIVQSKLYNFSLPSFRRLQGKGIKGLATITEPRSVTCPLSVAPDHLTDSLTWECTRKGTSQALSQTFRMRNPRDGAQQSVLTTWPDGVKFEDHWFVGKTYIYRGRKLGWGGRLYYLPWKKSESESESRSVVSNSLPPHGILQATILEWVAFPFSRRSSQPRDQAQVSCIAGRFFTSWATRKAQENWSG